MSPYATLKGIRATSHCLLGTGSVSGPPVIPTCFKSESKRSILSMDAKWEHFGMTSGRGNFKLSRHQREAVLDFQAGLFYFGG